MDGSLTCIGIDLLFIHEGKGYLFVQTRNLEIGAAQLRFVTETTPSSPFSAMCEQKPYPRGGSRIFLGGGALVSCSNSTPINHIVFFCRIPVVLENRRSSQGGGGGVVRTSCTLPLDPPLYPVWFSCRRKSFPVQCEHIKRLIYKFLDDGMRKLVISPRYPQRFGLTDKSIHNTICFVNLLIVLFIICYGMVTESTWSQVATSNIFKDKKQKSTLLNR